MGLLAIFGIENDALSTIVSLLVLFLVAVYIALVFWTYSDAKRRVADPLLVSCATVASLFPFVGTVVYLILRPPEYLEDVRERELEIAAAEARLVQLHDMSCPHCGYPIERAFLRCPSCHRRLKEPCATCRKPLDPRWKICPYCEAEVGQAPQQRRRRRTASPGATPGAQRPSSRPQPKGGAKPAPARDGETGDGVAPGRPRPGTAAAGAEPPARRSGPSTG
jgi:hypothetical protein